jgi:uncharacterized protein YoxC
METNRQAIVGENNLPELVQDKNGNTVALVTAVDVIRKSVENISVEMKKAANAVEDFTTKNTYNIK